MNKSRIEDAIKQLIAANEEAVNVLEELSMVDIIPHLKPEFPFPKRTLEVGSVSITSPVNGENLTAGALDVTYDLGSIIADEISIIAGTSENQFAHYSSGPIPVTGSTGTVTIPDINTPDDGTEVYVRLRHRLNGEEFLTANSALVVANAPGVNPAIYPSIDEPVSIVGKDLTVTIDIGDQVIDSLEMKIGNELDDDSYLNSGIVAPTQLSFSTVEDIPYNGSDVIITLSYLTNGSWESTSVTVPAATGPEVLSPQATSAIPETGSWTINLTQGSQTDIVIADWKVRLGVSGDPSSFFDSGAVQNGTIVIPEASLPALGADAQLRTQYRVSGGTFVSLPTTTHTRPTGGTVTAPTITNIADSATLTGTSQEISYQSNGTPVDEFRVLAGTIASPELYYNSGGSVELNQTAVNLPNAGEAVRFSLQHRLTGGAWTTSDTVDVTAFTAGSVPPPVAEDFDYGTTELDVVTGGQLYPRIPATFPNNPSPVASQAAFNAAYEAANPGDGIIIADGAASIVMSLAKGTGGVSGNPIYIVSQSHGGYNLPAKQKIAASDIVLGGFKTVKKENILVSGDRVRITSSTGTIIDSTVTNANTGAKTKTHKHLYEFNQTHVVGSGVATASDCEIDNCDIFYSPTDKVNNPGGGMIVHTKRNSGYRLNVHNNKFKSNSNCNGFLMFASDGQFPRDATHIYDDLPEGYHDTKFNNNHVETWPNNTGTHDMKTRRNTCRDNFFDGALYGIRHQSHDNLVTGNWFRNMPVELGRDPYKHPGWGNCFVFNYFDITGSVNRCAALMWKWGQDDKRGVTTSAQYKFWWSAFSTSDSIFSHNVFNGFDYTFRPSPYFNNVGKYPLLTDPAHKPVPENNEVKHNVFHSNDWQGEWLDAYYADGVSKFGAHSSYAEILSDNPDVDPVQASGSTNILDTTELVDNGEAYMPGDNIVYGSGGLTVDVSHLALSGDIETVTAPSWWGQRA